MTRPASFEHQQIVDLLTSTMRPFVETHQLGVVLSAPFQMKVGERGREPDLLFLGNEHRDRLKPTYLDGPADLVVEVCRRKASAVTVATSSLNTSKRAFKNIGWSIHVAR